MISKATILANHTALLAGFGYNGGISDDDSYVYVRAPRHQARLAKPLLSV